MGNPKGFMTVKRVDNGHRPINERIRDFAEVEIPLTEADRKLQASRCMDCGVPFCHWACPVANIMPEWQEKIYQGDWKAAYEILQDTNNFPEFTGRICPAPCESACVVAINDDSVTIRGNEQAVIERAFAEGYVKPHPPEYRTGKKVAVIGSGPAGLACADLLNKAGHTVTLFEAADKVGGFLRYGVPDFKLEKRVIDRRVNLLIEEGLIIQTGVRVGRDISAEEIRRTFDVVCITIGARKARDLNIEGRELDGIYQATDYLEQQSRIVSGISINGADLLSASCREVVVIGGGDTGSDCIGTANRQGARKITQIEILPALPESRPDNEPWPVFARLYKTTSSHEEGCERMFCVSTHKFIGDERGRVCRLEAVQVDWQRDANGQFKMVEKPGTGFYIDTDCVILAMGFEHPEHEGLVNDLGVKLTPRGNIAVDKHYMTDVPGVFAGGDAKRGASLVVWAIQEGREMARAVDGWLRG